MECRACGAKGKFQVVITDYKPNFALVRLASHSAAETSKSGETIRVADVCGRRIAMNDDGLILDQDTTHLVIAPDTSGLWKSSGSAI